MPPEIELSLAMIVRDEEELLARILGDAAQICDELVVVDTGSVDQTKEIALAFGAKVFEFSWCQDWAAARNASFEHCSNEWIIWLDADDRLSPAALLGFSQLKHFLAANTEIGAVRMRYHYTYSSSDPNRCLFSSDNVRMVRRTPELHWVGTSPHADLSVAPAPVIQRPEALWTTSAWVEHRTNGLRRARSSERNRDQLEAVIASGERTPMNLFFFADELRAQGRYEQAMQIYEEFLALCDEWRSSDLYARDIAVSTKWVRYEALIEMANCAEKMNQPDKKYALLLRALEIDGSRAGAFIELGQHHVALQEWPQAAAYFAAATVLTPPTDGLVFWDFYTYLPWDHLSICHGEMGMIEEAYTETVEALRTSPDRKRLFANLEYLLDRLQQGT